MRVCRVVVGQPAPGFAMVRDCNCSPPPHCLLHAVQALLRFGKVCSNYKDCVGQRQPDAFAPCRRAARADTRSAACARSVQRRTRLAATRGVRHHRARLRLHAAAAFGRARGPGRPGANLDAKLNMMRANKSKEELPFSNLTSTRRSVAGTRVFGLLRAPGHSELLDRASLRLDASTALLAAGGPSTPVLEKKNKNKIMKKNREKMA